MANRIRVAVIEDDSLQRALCVQVLGAAGDMMVVGAYETGRGALAELTSGPRQVDVVVVDLGLPDLAGAEVARQLTSLADPPEVVVLTAHGERGMALEALKSGASGYLLKGSPSEVVDAVRVAAGGGSTIAPAIARYLLDEVRVPGQEGNASLRDVGRAAGGDANDRNDERPALTRREREVLALLAKGATYEDAARLLGISLGTVQSHVKSLYRKLEVSSKAEAAAEAVRRGLTWP
ncbi:response regulator [Vulgatibacter sp.]|uniref:response regulator n=1 Tax=Vulgatibacter sp. TaxID=1971226 RepID=UPI00356ADF3D